MSSSYEEDDNEDNVYEVESIIDHAVQDGITYYRIRWVGYPPSEDSWETIENLNCPEKLREYQEKLEEKEKEREVGSLSIVETEQQIMENIPKPKKIIKSFVFAEHLHYRVQFEDGSYGSFSEKNIKSDYPYLLKDEQ
ncbi:M-phase phosphoprotein 8 isoform X2 [Histomonas meleagridis]|uniref:M-phase phosphoprotein 8 isoform X2 n=1 Tax=Histomonas meleagridis TaxID=135588 RepID=UPI0035598245|nr:M-phase phosphoprotein 8 isoform X2 [Histomonas meleagridis]KAH0796167.1 M-phase phosphoprotein 8 isoform X2 [Histomonas meleagridis]